MSSSGIRQTNSRNLYISFSLHFVNVSLSVLLVEPLFFSECCESQKNRHGWIVIRERNISFWKLRENTKTPARTHLLCRSELWINYNSWVPVIVMARTMGQEPKVSLTNGRICMLYNAAHMISIYLNKRFFLSCRKKPFDCARAKQPNSFSYYLDSVCATQSIQP